MREIKFRGKRVDNGEWVHGYYFEGFTGISYILILHDHILGMTEFYEVDPSTVGQYIGLKDKNGNEIYEGDIVTYSKSSINPLEVYFSEKLCHFALTPNSGSYLKNGAFDWKTLSDSKTGKLEIIGNIHDNPELLGESQVAYQKSRLDRFIDACNTEDGLSDVP